jgi:hypothetical protein
MFEQIFNHAKLTNKEEEIMTFYGSSKKARKKISK